MWHSLLLSDFNSKWTFYYISVTIQNIGSSKTSILWFFFDILLRYFFTPTEHKQRELQLASCRFCFENPKITKHLIIDIGKKVWFYLFIYFFLSLGYFLQFFPYFGEVKVKKEVNVLCLVCILCFEIMIKKSFLSNLSFVILKYFLYS